jgi:hypothetical protein
MRIFADDGEFVELEKVLAEAVGRTQKRLVADCLMLKPLVRDFSFWPLPMERLKVPVRELVGAPAHTQR